MLPKTHIVLGIIFSLTIFYLFPITIFQAGLIFLASIFIDIDHYLWYVFKKKDYSLKNSYKFFIIEKKQRKLVLFHTIEFHILIGLLGLIWSGFFYILIGMIFHSLMDIISLIYEKRLSSRKLSLIFRNI